VTVRNASPVRPFSAIRCALRVEGGRHLAHVDRGPWAAFLSSFFLAISGELRGLTRRRGMIFEERRRLSSP